ncbi:hypothetical protein LBMAG42_15650 [Deltaproteobacteria bacterium]|nr:hypothetical protein LBMAG42_15650 [Deltaproteobacteria bacterium]
MLALLLACSTEAPNPEPGDTAPVENPDTLPGTEDTGEAPDSGIDEDDTADDPELEAAAAETFYTFGVLQEVRLALTQETIDALDKQARRGEAEYLSGDVTINGTAFTNVGVRIKGSSTLRNFDDKPSLKIKLNAFVPDQDYAGLERITLNNMVEDNTQMKEVMVYKIFREAGIYTSRANHAALYVNDELYGLYTNLETMDDHWLEARYSDPSGELFEANDNADFTRSGVAYWESASGTGDTTQLDAVSDAIRGAGANYADDLRLYADMDQFYAFWAWSLLVGDVDGYPYTLNDCYVYADPADGNRFQFYPWGVDESWYSGAPGYWNYATGALAAGCLDNDTCKAEFVASMEAQLLVYDTLPIADWYAADAATSAATLAADPRRTFSQSTVASARSQLLADIAAWPGRIREAMRL